MQQTSRRRRYRNAPSFLDGVAAFVQTVAGGGEPHEGDESECKDEPRSRDGAGFDARFSYPWGIAYDGDTNSLYVADCVSR